MQLLLRWTRSELGEIVIAALAMAVVWLLLVAWRSRNHARGEAMRASVKDMAVVMSLVAILIFTVQPSLVVRQDWTHLSIVPFEDLLRSLDRVGRAREVAVANLVGNIVLFVPWGAALAARFGGMSFKVAFLLIAGLSSGVETVQTIWPIVRSSDVTDVLMNALGGVVGFVIIRAAMSVRPAPQPAGSAHPAPATDSTR